MENRNYGKKPNYNRESRQEPDGWFDPENYRNQEYRRYMNSQHENPGGLNTYDRNSNNRMGNEYTSGSSYQQQYGNRYQRPEGYSSGNHWSDRKKGRYERGSFGGYDREGSRDNYSGNREYYNSGDDNDRNWWDKAADEVSSWFGDEDAERRREVDRRQGPHKGKGPKGYSRSDERIREDINDKLYHDSFVDASNVEVTVNEGEAYITGTVDSRAEKRRIEDLAESVIGVKDVELKVKVRSPESGNSYDDRNMSSNQNRFNV